MRTIEIGTETYHVREPMAARLLREAKRLAREGRVMVARGLVALAMKIESGQLSQLHADGPTGEAHVAL